MRLSLLLYGSLLAAAAGLLGLVRPGLIGAEGRRAGALLAAAGLAGAVAALAWPARTRRAVPHATRFDGIVPAWEFDERHETRVAAQPERVYAALRSVTAREIRLFGTLTAVRRLGRAGRQDILNPPPDEPILDVATRTGFEWLADDPPREAAAGLRIGRDVFAAMAFFVEPDGPGRSRLVTVTRVHAVTARARRAFALYWRAILPGSDLIRRSWLRAIRLRAERDARESQAH